MFSGLLPSIENISHPKKSFLLREKLFFIKRFSYIGTTLVQYNISNQSPVYIFKYCTMFKILLSNYILDIEDIDLQNKYNIYQLNYR